MLAAYMYRQCSTHLSLPFNTAPEAVVIVMITAQVCFTHLSLPFNTAPEADVTVMITAQDHKNLQQKLTLSPPAGNNADSD
jgi:hypothetical protein